MTFRPCRQVSQGLPVPLSLDYLEAVLEYGTNNVKGLTRLNSASTDIGFLALLGAARSQRIRLDSCETIIGWYC